MNREALALLSKDELIDLVLSLAARLDELERRLGLNSTNSGKPPSSDGLSKPPAGKQKRRRTGSLREKSGRKPGGQKGHEGETLRQVAEPDAITDHYPETCPNCGSGLTPEMSTGHGAAARFSICPSPGPWWSWSIGRIVAVAGDVAGKQGPPFPLASPARCGMARGSGPWWSTCRTTSSCPKIVWPS